MRTWWRVVTHNGFGLFWVASGKREKERRKREEREISCQSEREINK